MEVKFSSLLGTHQGSVVSLVLLFVSCSYHDKQCTVYSNRRLICSMQGTTFNPQSSCKQGEPISQCTGFNVVGHTIDTFPMRYYRFTNCLYNWEAIFLCRYHRGCRGQLGQAARWGSIMPYEAVLAPPWLGDPRSLATPATVGVPPTTQP